MKTTNIYDAPAKQNPHGVDVRPLYNTEHAVISHLTLRPGEALKTHVTPVDAVFYILEGRGVVEIGEERKEVTKDTLVDSPKGIPHRLMNESDVDFRFLVLKLPRPEGSSKLL